MCGIVARLNLDLQKPVDLEVLERCALCIRHRGPDDFGVWGEGPVGFAHRRLSIIDLSPAGHGPMESVDGSCMMTFNGEVYNFQEIRPELEAKGYKFRSHTDTEVVLNAYLEWGVDCLKRFNGMFAFAIWDRPKRRLFVARDRFGVKPFSYFFDGKQFFGASEMKAILADPSIPRDIDPVALHHYLGIKSVPFPYTIYKGIRDLMPGHYLLIENGKLEERAWWHLTAKEESTESEEQILGRLEELLTDAVRLRLVSDVPVGTFLSGGVDSSVVSGIAAKLVGRDRLATFGVAFHGQGKYNESEHARKVAEHIGSVHTEIDMQPNFLEALPEVFGYFDEPFAVTSAMPLHLMSKVTSEHVKVILTGDGGDEVFGGYTRQLLLDHRLDKIARLPLSSLRNLVHRPAPQQIRWRLSTPIRRLLYAQYFLSRPDAYLRRHEYGQEIQAYNEAEKFAMYTPEWAEHVRSQPDFCSTDAMLSPLWPEHAPNRLSSILQFDLNSTLGWEMLRKVDRTTMRWSIEARTPFLDYRLVQYAMTLPQKLMAEVENGKKLVKKVAERYVPAEVLYRPKQGFSVPLRNWLREPEVPPIFSEALSSNGLKRHGVFQASVVNEILQRHRNDLTTDFSNQIFVVVAHEIWRQAAGL